MARRLPSFLRAGALALAVGLALVSPRDADACGACYSQTSESTIVSDHRMALSISQERTILWDQIRYQGSPSEFAYVVPIRRGAYLEASNEAWFTALDAATRPIVMQPQVAPSGAAGRRLRNVGCGGGSRAVSGCSADTYDDESAAGEAAADPPAPPPVEIVNEEVVGPYESVTVRSRDPEELGKWLTDHGFTVPRASAPVIADFVLAGFDFIALRLRPGNSVRAMKPIRIVSPGADTTMPLRMMKIGAGSKLGITLWVIAEGRYQVRPGFVNVAIDAAKLTWDFTQNRSSYQELSRAAMATGRGRGVLTEYADRPSFELTGQTAPRAGMTQNLGVADVYAVSCRAAGVRAGEWSARQFPAPTSIADGGVEAGSGDAGTSDTDAGAPGDLDAGGPLDPADAGDGVDDGLDGGVIAPVDGGVDDGDGGEADGGAKSAQAVCDDVSAALHDLHQGDVWITRMRMDLPYDVLDDTLRLEAEPTQSRVENIYTARDSRTINKLSVSRRGPVPADGTWFTVGLTALALARILERRRKR